MIFFQPAVFKNLSGYLPDEDLCSLLSTCQNVRHVENLSWATKRMIEMINRVATNIATSLEKNGYEQSYCAECHGVIFLALLYFKAHKGTILKVELEQLVLGTVYAHSYIMRSKYGDKPLENYGDNPAENGPYHFFQKFSPEDLFKTFRERFPDYISLEESGQLHLLDLGEEQNQRINEALGPTYRSNDTYAQYCLKFIFAIGQVITEQHLPFEDFPRGERGISLLYRSIPDSLFSDLRPKETQPESEIPEQSSSKFNM